MSQMNYEYCDGVTHTIKKGDTLYEISRKHNVPLALLLRANPYVDVFNLQVGDTICIPASQNQMTPYQGGSMQEKDSLEKKAPKSGIIEETGGISCTGKPRGEVFEEEKDTGAVEQQNTPEVKWEKYVVNPGDTMADVLESMNGDVETFLEKNQLSTIYMLPGVAYYICRQ